MRIRDRDQCAQTLATSLPDASLEVKSLLLELLDMVGGSAALDIVIANARSPSPEVQNVETQVMGS